MKKVLSYALARNAAQIEYKTTADRPDFYSLNVTLASSGVTTDRNADFGTVKILISSTTSNSRNSQVWAGNARKMSAKKDDFDYQIMEKKL